MPFDPGLQKVYLMAESKNCIMATFNQDDFLPEVSEGACLELTIRFISQSIRGMPPLGIDLEKGLQQNILRVPANSAIYRAYPSINDAIRVGGPFSNPQHSVNKPFLNDEQLLARAKQDGFDLKSLGPMLKFTNEAFLKGIMSSLQTNINTIRTLGKGWVLFIIKGPKGTHAMAFHIGHTNHLMFVDVNSGWYHFSDGLSAADFLKRYWEYMNYNGYNQFAAYYMSLRTVVR